MSDLAESPFELANKILIDSGVDIKSLRTGQYDDLVNAVGDGDFDFSIEKAQDGYFDIVFDKDEKTKESNCPSWMPVSLCEGYAKISKNLSVNPTLVGAIAGIGDAAGIQEIGPDIESYGQRIVLVVLGLILLGVGIFFLASGSVKDIAIDSVVGAIKG